jgi:hypothetical protein
VSYQDWRPSLGGTALTSWQSDSYCPEVFIGASTSRSRPTPEGHAAHTSAASLSRTGRDYGPHEEHDKDPNDLRVSTLLRSEWPGASKSVIQSPNDAELPARRPRLGVADRRAVQIAGSALQLTAACRVVLCGVRGQSPDNRGTDPVEFARRSAAGSMSFFYRLAWNARRALRSFIAAMNGASSSGAASCSSPTNVVLSYR